MYRLLASLTSLSSMLALTVALCGALVLSACGGDDDDPVPGACASACEIKEGDVCFSKKAECKMVCEKVGTQAQRDGWKPNACATCQIGLVKYAPSTDGKSCWGVQTPTNFANDTCKSVCFDPLGP